jgi:uridine kinase
MWKSARNGSKQFVKPSEKNADIVINAKSSDTHRESVIKEIFTAITEASRLSSFKPPAKIAA